MFQIPMSSPMMTTMLGFLPLAWPRDAALPRAWATGTENALEAAAFAAPAAAAAVEATARHLGVAPHDGAVVQRLREIGERRRPGIDDMLASSALLSSQSSNAAQQQTRYEADLKKLDERMAQLLERYNQQFTAMESLISQINSQKSGLKSTFDAMLNQSK